MPVEELVKGMGEYGEILIAKQYSFGSYRRTYRTKSRGINSYSKK